MNIARQMDCGSPGLFNTFGNTAGITTPIEIGYILQATGSFAGALIFVGANAAVAIVCYLFLVGDIRRFAFNTPVTPAEHANAQFALHVSRHQEPNGSATLR